MAKEPIQSQESARDAEAITPSDTVDLDRFTRGLYVGVAGDVTAVMRDGSVILFTALAAGIVHPISVQRVNATATAATSIVALY